MKISKFESDYLKTIASHYFISKNHYKNIVIDNRRYTSIQPYFLKLINETNTEEQILLYLAYLYKYNSTVYKEIILRTISPNTLLWVCQNLSKKYIFDITLLYHILANFHRSSHSFIEFLENARINWRPRQFIFDDSLTCWSRSVFYKFMKINEFIDTIESHLRVKTSIVRFDIDIKPNPSIF